MNERDWPIDFDAGSWDYTEIPTTEMNRIPHRWIRGLLPFDGIVVGQGGAIFSAPVNEAVSPPTITWQQVPSPVSVDLEAISPGGFFRGYSDSVATKVAVGADGMILVPGENGWVIHPSGTTQRLRGVCFKSGGWIRLITNTYTVEIGEFFAVGTGGIILRSAGGAHWQNDVSPTPHNLNAVTRTANHVIIVGDGGTILRAGGGESAPLITRPPTTGVDANDQPYAEAGAAGQGGLTYLWVQLTGGAPYPVGSDYPRQSLAQAPFAFARGTFQLLVGNAFGITRSAPFTPNRFLNLAARAAVGAGDNILIGGFSIAGTGEWERRTMLIRAIGPSLATFGVVNALKAPRLSLYAGAQLVATNAGWESNADAAAIRSAAQTVGAFPLADGSMDSALLLSLAPGNYTAQVASTDGSTGIALVEVYDTAPPSLSRLQNLSARAQVQGGAGVLIGGLVIEGGVKKSVLLRAAGPALGAYGVPGPLGQPRLTVFQDGKVIATAADWGAAVNADAIRAAAKAVNAFAFPDGSPDAAMLLELDPGAYTLHVTGADGGSGVALVEVYEAP